MPRVEIPVFTLTPAGLNVTSGANETVGDPANGHFFQNDLEGMTALWVRNTDASTRFVSVTPAVPQGMTATTSLTVSVVTSGARWLGPFSAGEWNQVIDSDRVWVNVEHAGIRLRVVRFPQGQKPDLSPPAHIGSRVLIAHTPIVLPSVDGGSGGQTTGDAVNGHHVTPFSKQVAVWLSNEGAVTRWADFKVYPAPGGQAINPVRYSLTAGQRFLVGGFHEPYFGQGNDGGRLHIAVEHADMKLRSFRVGA